MKRREFIKKTAACGAAVLGLGSLSLWPQLAGAAQCMETEQGYYRIVVLGDPHLPVREREAPGPEKQSRIIAAKNRVADDISGWDDVDRIAVVGDVAAQFGKETEYQDAQRYFARLRQPLSVIGGNHDYIYEDAFSAAGHFVLADAQSRQSKLQRFRETFSLPEMFYSLQAGRYRLLFLSPDELNTRHLAQLSERQLSWFAGELAGAPDAPAVVFFHAPLAGTLPPYAKNINTPDFIAEPAGAIQELLRRHPQVRLWVSGHTHTPATNPGYAADVNLYDGRVLNVHNADMDRETIWTNSLYLYPDRIVIRTFNHREGRWLDSFDRTVMALPPG